MGVRLKVGSGLHTLSSTLPLSAISYGYAEYDAYAHLVGIGLGCSTEVPPNACLLGIQWMSGQSLLHDIDAVTGAATNPRNTGLKFPIGLDVATNGNVLAISSGFGEIPKLVKINRTTGASSVIAQITEPSSLFEGDMAIAPPGSSFSGDIFYTGNDKLYRMNAAGGAQTFIGTVPAGTQPRKLSGISFNSAGQLFGIDTAGSAAYVFELDTGTAAIIGTPRTVSMPLGRLAGFDFDPGSSTFYLIASATDAGGGNDRLFTINVATGLVAPKPSLIPTANGGFSGLAIAPCECLTLTCPADIVVQSANANGQVVTFQPIATNPCGGAPVVTSTPASGSLFPIGTTVVQSEAADSAGATISCSFKVTVLPSIAITILAGGEVAISWTGIATLQETTDLAVPFQVTPEAKSPYVVRPMGARPSAQKFFRVISKSPP